MVQITIASKDFKRRDGEFRFAIDPLEKETKRVLGFNVRLDSSYEGKLFSGQIGSGDPRLDDAFREFLSESNLLNDDKKELVYEVIDNLHNQSMVTELIKNKEYRDAAEIINYPYLKSKTFLDALYQVYGRVEGLIVRDAFNRNLYLHTGELGAPMQAMQKCLDELYSHWGIDVEAHRTLSRPVRPLNFDDFSQRIRQDYPKAMISKRLEGYLRVRLSVSADGRPTACHLQSPLNDETFNRTACDTLMEHAQFSPALDAVGRPIASFFQTSIVYRLSTARR